MVKTRYDGAGRSRNKRISPPIWAVTADESEWSLNLLKDCRASSRLVVPWPRHVPGLSFLCDFHNEYGATSDIGIPRQAGQHLSYFLAFCWTASSLLQRSVRLPLLLP